MAGPKRRRQRAIQQQRSRRAAAEALQRRAQRRRRLIVLGGSALLAAAVAAGILLFAGDDDDETVTAGATSTIPTTTTVPSAKGKPCVPTTGELPAGAPAVPVKAGPAPTQLVKQDLKRGPGAEVTPGATVTVNYIGVACSTGKIFDSSYVNNQPATFPLSNVIKGWQDGIPGMKVGGQRLLGIPSELAYAAQPPPGSGIAPDEALWFVVEVLDAKPA